MPVLQAELKWYKSEAISDATTNGGRPSNALVITGQKGNIFPDVSDDERLPGITRYRKVFAAVDNTSSDKLLNTKLHFLGVTPAEDYVTLFEGTSIDRQADITGAERNYGNGFLTSTISPGDTTFDVSLQSSSQVIFNEASPDNTIVLYNGADAEYFDNVSAVKVGPVVTLSLDTGDAIVNTYTAANGSVGSVLTLGTLETTTTGFAVITVGTGSYDDTTYPLEGDNIATVQDVFTLTFTSASNFTVAGVLEGILPPGQTTVDYSPPNTNKSSRPYFTLRAAGFGGAFQTGDTITFTTHPVHRGIWLKSICPAGAASYSGNNFFFRLRGESS